MNCDFHLTYNDDTWAKIVSPDQEGCNAYLQSIRSSLLGAKVLHVGTGNGSVLTQFHNILGQLDGITVMDSEMRVADKQRLLYDLEYKVYNFNKYDIRNFQILGNDYDIIIDNNLKQHACCNVHWIEYFHCLLRKITPSGKILTHTQGFAPHSDRVDWLTISELETLLSETIYQVHIVLELINNNGHPPVVIKAQHA